MHSLVSRSTDRKKKFLVLFAAVTMSISALAAPINAAPVAQSSATDSGLGSVYFAPMSSKLSNNAKRDLDTIIAANPGVQKFNVVGYSQWAPWGTAKSYERISMLRAASVTSYMKSKGVTVEILNESGGLPETGGKTSKARKATVFSIKNSAQSASTPLANNGRDNSQCGTNFVEGILTGTDIQIRCFLESGNYSSENPYSESVRVTTVTTSDDSEVYGPLLKYIFESVSGSTTLKITKDFPVSLDLDVFAIGDRFEIWPQDLSEIAVNYGNEMEYTYRYTVPFSIQRTNAIELWRTPLELKFFIIQSGSLDPELPEIYELVILEDT